MPQCQFRSDDTTKWKYGFGNGQDGDFVVDTNTTDSPIDSSCSGSTGEVILNATNPGFESGQLILIHKSRGNTTTQPGTWELNKIVSYESGEIILETPLCNSYQTDTGTGINKSQVLVLKQYRSVTINPEATLSVKNWNQSVGGILAFLCKGTTLIEGNIVASGAPGAVGVNLPGATVGGFCGSISNAGTGSGQDGRNAEGHLLAPNNLTWQILSIPNSGGTGQGGNTDVAVAGGGSGGGNGEQGQNNTGEWGANVPGKTSGNPELTLMLFGGGGGGGARNKHSQNDQLSSGSSGGGIIAIFSKKIVVSGQVECNGGNSAGTGNRCYGGAGAGGSIILKGKNIDLGDNKVAALGGTGGVQGGGGGAGRINIDYSKSATATTTPTANLRFDKTVKSPNDGGGAALMMT